MQVKQIDWSAATNTSLQGYVVTTYAELVKAFGEPNGGPGDKTTCEWIIAIGGHVVTIYDWKTDSTPQGKYEWHIGGIDRRAVAAVQHFFPGAWAYR